MRRHWQAHPRLCCHYFRWFRCLPTTETRMSQPLPTLPSGIAAHRSTDQCCSHKSFLTDPLILMDQRTAARIRTARRRCNTPRQTHPWTTCPEPTRSVHRKPAAGLPLREESATAADGKSTHVHPRFTTMISQLYIWVHSEYPRITAGPASCLVSPAVIEHLRY